MLSPQDKGRAVPCFLLSSCTEIHGTTYMCGKTITLILIVLLDSGIIGILLHDLISLNTFGTENRHTSDVTMQVFFQLLERKP